MRDETGRLWNVQRINETGSKRFLTGGRKAGLFHLLDTPGGATSLEDLGERPVSSIIIAEGYATAASLHENTGSPCICAFDAGNLKAVAETVRWVLPEADIVLAADNDHTPDTNVGVERATEAARAVGGSVIVPPLNEAQKAAGMTDFNDMT
ncbi:toprim domain-containing protein [Phaeovibrio sulfidiphilus]|uniref:Toprim domain-containing protein n=1 Tax=Phaeovibrio sulfidiphilus TaxID=1220600 RepID=A0A8J7CWF4_9PROT|nr:toprim domain-containing protein [Phaeovibrio sulfidiphilus]MBE1237411.1 toprim domain-containing protein [Phaeovibrio sulfidiphilus]